MVDLKVRRSLSDSLFFNRIRGFFSQTDDRASPRQAETFDEEGLEAQNGQEQRIQQGACGLEIGFEGFRFEGTPPLNPADKGDTREEEKIEV